MHAAGGDFAAREGGFVELQFGNSLKTAAVFVTAGTMEKEIADGVQFEASQLGVALRSHPGNFAQGRLQWILGSWHNLKQTAINGNNRRNFDL
jgi:hypothetical protein